MLNLALHMHRGMGLGFKTKVPSLRTLNLVLHMHRVIGYGFSIKGPSVRMLGSAFSLNGELQCSIETELLCIVYIAQLVLDVLYRLAQSAWAQCLIHNQGTQYR